MKILKTALWIVLAVIVAGLAYGTILVRRGFSTKDQPSLLETAVARTARNWSIPSSARERKESLSGHRGKPRGRPGTLRGSLRHVSCE